MINTLRARLGYVAYIAALVLLAIIVLLGFRLNKTEGIEQVKALSAPVDITNELKYRWEENKKDVDLIPLLLSTGLEDPSWKTLDAGNKLPSDLAQKEALIRVQLPKGNWVQPCVSFKAYAKEIAVYCDYKLAYANWEEYLHKGVILNYPYYIIPLPQDFQGKILSFKIRSDFYGTDRFISDIEVGEKSDLVSKSLNHQLETVKNQLYYIILSSLFISIGLFLFLIFLTNRVDLEAFFYLGFSSICIGLWVLFENNIIAVFINNKQMTHVAASVAIQLMPIGFIGFAEDIFSKGGSPIYKRIRQSLFVWTLATFILDTCNIVSFLSSIKIFHVLLLIPIGVILLTVIKALSQGNKEAKLYTLGFTILSLAGLLDIIDMFYKPLPFLFGVHVTAFAMFFFVLLLLFILSKRLEIINHKMRRYASEISELNRTLECKVHARTEELETANEELTAINEELTATMEALQQTELQLVQSEKMASLGNLVAGVAHEINTPLATIKSNQQMVSMLIQALEPEDIQGVADFKESVIPMYAVNKDALERIIEIVKSLKNFARLDEAEVKEVSLHDGLDSTLALVMHQLSGRIRLVKEYGELPPVTCYPQQLNQVFLNIIVNAIQAMENGGTLRISTNYMDEKVILRFQDTGSGISLENLPRIFDPGFTTKSSGVGTGLGLSISYQIIQKHKGTIQVESNQSTGTVFTILLPLSVEEA